MAAAVLAVASGALSGATSSARAQDAEVGEAGPTISLPAAIERAVTTSLRVRQAGHDLQGQVERRRGAWADVGPRVNAEFNYVKFEKAQTATFGGNQITLRPEVSKVGNITVVQPLTGALALAKNARLQGTLEESKELALRQAKTETAFAAAEAYLRTLAARRQLTIAETSIRAAEEQAKDAAALARVGRMNRGDVLRLDLSVSEAKARAAQARAGAQIAMVALKETLGVAQEQALALDANPPAVAEPETGSLDQAVKSALARRIDDDQAELGVEAAAFGKSLAYSGFSPSVNAFMKQERNFGEASGLGGGDKDTRTYGIQATWALWENGSRVFAVRAASEDTAKAEAGRDALLQGIRLELAQLLANLGAAKESVELAETAVRQAEEAYRIEAARFETGSRSATDLILAETSRSGAQGRLVTARTELEVLFLKLQKALGDERPVLANAANATNSQKPSNTSSQEPAP